MIRTHQNMASPPPVPVISASEKVFSTYELLEQILLHFSLRHLLLAQRINKAAFDIVASSHDIRRALFCKASSSVKEAATHRGLFNPFLTV